MLQLFYIASIAFIAFCGVEWAVQEGTANATETRDVWQASRWGVGMGITVEPARGGEFAYAELWLWPEERGYLPIMRFYGAAPRVRGMGRPIHEPLQEVSPGPVTPLIEPQEPQEPEQPGPMWEVWEV